MTKIAGINLLSTYCVTALCWATMLFPIIYMSRFRFLDLSTNNSYIVDLQLYYLKCSSAHLLHKLGSQNMSSLERREKLIDYLRGLPLVSVVLSIWPFRKPPNLYRVRDSR